jgi:hypothetical protein
LTVLPPDPLDLLYGWPWTIVVLLLAWIAARRRIGLTLVLWLPAFWLAVRLLDPVVGPTPPGPIESAWRYLQAAILAFGPPLLMLLAVRRRPSP